MHLRAQLKLIFYKISEKSPKLAIVLKRVFHRIPFDTGKKSIKGKNNRLISKNAILKNVDFDVNGDNNQIEIEDLCLLYGVTFYLRGNNHKIKIGRGCVFSRGGELTFEDNNCSLTIGDNSTFENVHIALTEPYSEINIGEDCMFAYDIDIRTGDSHSIIDVTTGNRLNFAKSISIGNHVWVATHCIILKGAKVLDNSVVATGSCVTKSFNEECVIIAGSPGKVVKRGITWDRKRMYNV